MAATGKEGSGKREADGDGEKGLHGIRDGFQYSFGVNLCQPSRTECIVV